MSSPHQRLAEGLPERHPPGKNSFQAEAKALKSWIDALPMANPSAAARLLFNALREMNQLRIDPMTRLAAMEALRGPVTQIAETVDRQILGSSFPLPPQKQQLGAIAQDFQKELGVGYRICAYELCLPDGRVPFLRGKAVSIAIVRSLAHLSAQLCKAYLVYATPPAGTWSALHDLFRFAQTVKLDDKAIEDPLLENASLSPRSCYQHALLLAICNPFRLTQKEIADAYLATRAWAPETVLRAGASSAASFAIPVDEDRGPGYLPEERRSHPESLLSFETGPLERYLDRQLALTHGMAGPISFRLESSASVSLTPEHIRRLMAAWQPAASRAFERVQARHELDTLVGLHGIHYFLAGQTDFESFMRQTRGPGISMTERDRGASSWTSQAAELAPDRIRAQVLDQSLGGYRLLWDKALAVRARVGEVVGMALPPDGEDDDPDWMVGVIRWLRISPDGAVDAGVELLARQARAAALRTIDNDGRPKPPVRAIALEPMNMNGSGGHDVFSLLAPNVVEKNARQFELTRAPERLHGEDEATVDVIEDLEVLEQPGTYYRLGKPQPVPIEAPPTEMFDALSDSPTG
jgi:hypothetical protein